MASAGADAGVDGFILERLGAPDHPMTLEFPEGEYLKGWSSCARVSFPAPAGRSLGTLKNAPGWGTAATREYLIPLKDRFMALIPVTILTGFPWAHGQTTLLKRLLSEAHGQKIAVIENEFGEENIDNDILVTESKEQIVQMSNGCICCTIREDLRETLQLLAAKRSEVCSTLTHRDRDHRRGRPGPRWRRPSSWTKRSPRPTSSTPSSRWWMPNMRPSSSTTAREAPPGGVCGPDLPVSKTDLVPDETDALIHRLNT